MTSKTKSAQVKETTERNVYAIVKTGAGYLRGKRTYSHGNDSFTFNLGSARIFGRKSDAAQSLKYGGVSREDRKHCTIVKLKVTY